jgi:1-phosphatidylinositol-4-phosphate 5-kinase
MDVGGELGELASDIQQQAEQIRKERLSKRKEQEKLRAEQEVNKLARTTSLVRALSIRGDEKPIMGNLIGEGHVNYVLMFNMLTGIRVAVSRCQAKMRRPLTNEDYSAANKYSFDL